jgi:hypothetical protein
MKTVIEMAKQADIEWDLIDEDEGRVWYITQAALERFAELVRADEREKGQKRIERLVELVRADEREKGQKWFDAVTAQHKQAILAEREACAKVVDEFVGCESVAYKIRARSNT